jgi:hypothetical protein
MKRKGAEGLPADPTETPAANEDFNEIVGGLDTLERVDRPRSGWDPYEVWRTRVKASSTVKSEREGGPLR